MKDELFSSKTQTGKPKLIDRNGFSVATAPFSTQKDRQNIARLEKCWNVLRLFTDEQLDDILSGRNDIIIQS